MNQKTGIVIGVVILLITLLGVGAYLMMKKTSSPITTVKTEQPVVQKTTSETVQGTLKSLFASGKSVKCSFSNSATDSAKVSGTVYVAGGKMRGDFQTTSSNVLVNSHMIVDSQNSYLWTDTSKQGLKFAMASQQATASGKSQGVDMNQAVNYSCQDWSADNSMFTLPADITFSSFAVPAAPSTTGVSSQCAACDNVPAGAGRDACKAQLHCP